MATPLIDVGPVQALALVGVFQAYLTYKAVRLIGELAWCSLTRRELAPAKSRYAMRSRPAAPELRVIHGGLAA